MDSTQAQHRAGAGGHASGHALSLSDEDGEEVEGGGRRGARGAPIGVADSAAGRGDERPISAPGAIDRSIAPLETGPAAVDSAPPESVRFPTAGIGDGFVEAESGKFGINPAIAGGFAVGAAPAGRRAAGRGARRRAGAGKALRLRFNAGGGGTGESGDARLSRTRATRT